MNRPNCVVKAVPPTAMNAPMIAVDPAAAVSAGAIRRVLTLTKPSGVAASLRLFAWREGRVRDVWRSEEEEGRWYLLLLLLLLTWR